MKTGYESNAHTARETRGVARCFRSWLSLSRGLLCVLLTVCLAFVPFNVHSGSDFMIIEKSEAKANPAVVAGGAAIAALAAELGISETALVLGICAVGAAGTGLAFYSASRTDVATPGFRPWDDLTPQEKQDWVGQDGTSKDYYDQQIAWWALQYGLLEIDENGNPVPTPEPENDPNGHSRWQKARNVMIALAAGGASVALNDALAPFVDNAAAAVKDFLFGGSGVPGGSLDIYYGSQYQITGNDSELNVNFCTIPTTYVDTHGDYVGSADTFRTNQWTMMRTDATSTDVWQVNGTYTSTSDVRVNEYRDNQNHYYWAVTTTQSNPQRQFRYTVNNGTISLAGATSSATQTFPPYGSNLSVYLNANFIGIYPFRDYSGNVIATYQNGQMTGAATYVGANYGQMVDTPTGLVDSILDPTAFANWVNSYTNAGQGEKRAVTVPSGFSDGNFTPTYDSFVDVVPEGDVIPIPDTEPLPAPNPNDPFNDVDFQQDFGDTVGELLSRPFSQLFPFCLINDLNVLTDKIEGAIYPSSGGMSVQAVEPVNGTAVLVIPLSDFGIPDVDDMTFDLSTLVQFGHMIRPWTTTLFILALLIGSFRFFLNRGGE